jgi:AraC-like DNA-binding protein
MTPNNPIREDQDLRFHYAGIEQCSPGHSWKNIRDQYVVYFVLSGRGLVRYGCASYTLSAGNGFSFFPGDLSEYRADIDDPWQYAWIGFSGKTAEQLLSAIGITRDQPVYRSREPEAAGAQLRRIVEVLAHSKSEFERMSQLYGLFYTLERHRCTDSVDTADSVLPIDYVDAAYRYIRASYSRKDCTVESMAQRLGLTRNYLSALLRKRTGMSPKALLTNYRIAQAKLLLSRTLMPIAEIAEAVGYADPLCFSRAFHKVVGISPSACRQMTYKYP